MLTKAREKFMLEIWHTRSRRLFCRYDIHQCKDTTYRALKQDVQVFILPPSVLKITFAVPLYLPVCKRHDVVCVKHRRFFKSWAP